MRGAGCRMCNDLTPLAMLLIIKINVRPQTLRRGAPRSRLSHTYYKTCSLGRLCTRVRLNWTTRSPPSVSCRQLRDNIHSGGGGSAFIGGRLPCLHMDEYNHLPACSKEHQKKLVQAPPSSRALPHTGDQARRWKSRL